MEITNSTITLDRPDLVKAWCDAISYYGLEDGGHKRPIKLTPCFGQYNSLSTVVFEINGSPTKQTAIIEYRDYARMGEVSDVWRLTVLQPYGNKPFKRFECVVNDRNPAVGIMSTILDLAGLPTLCREDTRNPNKVAVKYYIEECVRRYLDDVGQLEYRDKYERKSHFVAWLDEYAKGRRWRFDLTSMLNTEFRKAVEQAA